MLQRSTRGFLPYQLRSMCSFRDKIVGKESSPPPMADASFIAKSGAGAFAGIGMLSVIHHLAGSEYTMVLGSFGASAVLLFAAPAVPFSQPRNVIGGHVISAFMGVSVHKVFGDGALALPLAASCSVMAMQATNCVHPPAGGTALIAVIGSPMIFSLGYGLLVPTFVGSTLLTGTAVLFNNSLRGKLKYPQYWW